MLALKTASAICVVLLALPGVSVGEQAKLVPELPFTLQMASEYQLDNFIDFGSNGGWNLKESHYQVTFRRRLQNWDWMISVRRSEFGGDISHSSKDNLNILIEPTPNRIQADLLVKSTLTELTTNGWWRTASGNQSEGGLSVTWRPTRALQGGLGYSRRHPLGYNMELYYLQEGGRFDWKAPLSTWSFNINFVPLNGWAFVSSASRAEFLPVEPEVSSTSVGAYLATIDGIVRGRSFRLESYPRGDVSCALELRELSAEAMILGYVGGLRFAHFGQAHFSYESWSLEMAYGLHKIDFQRGTGEGELAGTVEAWPFVSGLARFLGERRHLVSTGEISWYRLRLSDEFAISRHLRLNTISQFVRVDPEFRYVTWRPLAMGMGVDDLKPGRFEISRADLIQVTLSPKLQVQKWTLHLAVSQWIPLAITKIEDPNIGADSRGGVNADTNGSSDNSAHDGFIFSAALAFSI